MNKKVTNKQLNTIAMAHKAVCGTVNYTKYLMCMEYKYKKDDKWTGWKFVSWTIPTVLVNNTYYFKTVKGKLYIMIDRENEVERYEVTPAVKDLLGI